MRADRFTIVVFRLVNQYLPESEPVADAKAIGFLVDSQIRERLDAGDLLEQGTWQPELIRHASYTLRLGNSAQLCRAVDASLAPVKEFTIVHVNQETPLVLQPGDTARLYSLEHLRIPENVMAFTVARGLLFVEALCPENTYVDPGFKGTLYTTVTNLSNRTISLPYKMQITRLFFFHLNTSVTSPYVSGSALNIDQQLESVPCVPVNTGHVYSQVSDDQLIESVSKQPLIGPHLKELFRRLNDRRLSDRFQLYLVAILWPIVTIIISRIKSIPADFWPQVGANALGGLAVAVVLYLTEFLPKRHVK